MQWLQTDRYWKKREQLTKRLECTPRIFDNESVNIHQLIVGRQQRHSVAPAVKPARYDSSPSSWVLMLVGRLTRLLLQLLCDCETSNDSCTRLTDGSCICWIDNFSLQRILACLMHCEVPLVVSWLRLTEELKSAALPLMPGRQRISLTPFPPPPSLCRRSPAMSTASAEDDRRPPTARLVDSLVWLTTPVVNWTKTALTTQALCRRDTVSGSEVNDDCWWGRHYTVDDERPLPIGSLAVRCHAPLSFIVLSVKAVVRASLLSHTMWHQRLP
jgi:hypothetical protein